MTLPPLTPVDLLVYRQTEQHLKTIYQNQEKIYSVLQALIQFEYRKSGMTEETFRKFAGLNEKRDA